MNTVESGFIQFGDLITFHNYDDRNEVFILNKATPKVLQSVYIANSSGFSKANGFSLRLMKRDEKAFCFAQVLPCFLLNIKTNGNMSADLRL